MSTSPEIKKWQTQLLQRIKMLLQQVFSKKTVTTNLEPFLSDDNKAYKSFGGRSDDYKEALAKSDTYFREHPIDQELIDAEDDPEMKKVIKSSLEMIDERQRLMKKYDEDKKASGFSFKLGKWLHDNIKEGGSEAIAERIMNDLNEDQPLNQ